MSPSSRAEWVEISCIPLIVNSPGMSPSSRAEWVEIVRAPHQGIKKKSPSSRAEWVEMVSGDGIYAEYTVSVLAGGVG